MCITFILTQKTQHSFPAVKLPSLNLWGWGWATPVPPTELSQQQAMPPPHGSSAKFSTQMDSACKIRRLITTGIDVDCDFGQIS